MKFFESNIKKLREVKKQREDYLITLYDSIYGEESSKTLTYEEFKNKYLKSIQMGNKSVKEAFAVMQIKRIIEDKDFEEVDTVF